MAEAVIKTVHAFRFLKTNKKQKDPQTSSKWQTYLKGGKRLKISGSPSIIIIYN